MRCVSLAVALLVVSAAHAADDLAVDVQNASEPTLCAEKDNVYPKLTAPEVRQLYAQFGAGDGGFSAGILFVLSPVQPAVRLEGRTR